MLHSVCSSVYACLSHALSSTVVHFRVTLLLLEVKPIGQHLYGYQQW